MPLAVSVAIGVSQVGQDFSDFAVDADLDIGPRLALEFLAQARAQRQQAFSNDGARIGELPAVVGDRNELGAGLRQIQLLALGLGQQQSGAGEGERRRAFALFRHPVQLAARDGEEDFRRVVLAVAFAWDEILFSELADPARRDSQHLGNLVCADQGHSSGLPVGFAELNRPFSRDDAASDLDEFQAMVEFGAPDK